MNNINKNGEIEISLPDLASNTRGSGTLYWGTGASFSMIVDWSTSPNVGGGYTTVSVSMRMEKASVSGTCRAGSHITINGNGSPFEGKQLSYGGNGADFTIHSHSVNVHHTSGVNVGISGAWAWSGYIWINGGYTGNFNTVSGSAEVWCDGLLTAPNAPTWCNHDGWFDNGGSTTVSWGGASGTIDNYRVQVRFWDRSGDSFGGWFDVGTPSGTSFDIGHDGVIHDALQARVRSENSAGQSGWCEGGWVYKQGVRVNENGFRRGRIRVWNGSSWVQGYVRVWNGSSWVHSK